MRILKCDWREGIVRLQLQAVEDLWHLYKVLEPGDFVRARTYRKVAVKRGQEIMEGEKKPVNLTIRVEKSDFHQYTGRLRVSGTITAGPEDIQLASRHTIALETGMIVTVRKAAWKRYQRERLEKARVREADLFFVCLDRERADFAVLGGIGLEMKGGVAFAKTENLEDRASFYESISATLEAQDAGKIVLCGPGFERTNLFAYIRKKHPALSRKILIEHCSATGLPGIQEVLKTSGTQLLKETRVARETRFVQKLLIEIARHGLAAYKKEPVEKAIAYGAVGTLLVSDTKVKEFEDILNSAEESAARIVLISTEHEAGEQLLGLGGIAGLLRFRV